MTTYSDELHGQLVQRIGVLTDEADRLTEARRILVGADVTPQRKSARKAAPKRERIVIPAGASIDRAMALITAQPGLKAGEIGPTLGLHKLGGYPLVNKLAEQGLVTKASDGRWYPA